ncbi:MAG TPA: AraC family transcriptional regulator, partial [Sinorhizobium sp.]|nr:AraC family transcriptional regulator [Sinorhizobium sp.]
MLVQRSGTRLSYQGSDADEVADILTRCTVPVRVQRPWNKDFSYSYEFVAAGSAAFSRVNCQGELSIGQRNEEPKFLILFPLQGATTIKVGKQSLISEPGKATILDGTRLSEMRFEESRSHYSFFVDQGDIIRHVSSMLERPVDGSLDFAPDFNLETGSGQIIFRLAQILAKSVGDDAAMHDMPQTLSYLSKSLINLLVETVPHRFS